MSGGLNSAFLTAMRGNATQIPYLRNNIFASQPQINAAGGQRIVNLSASISGIEVRTAPTNRSTFSNAFNAWWLPNNQNAAAAITVGTVGADIIFTPALTGCILEINGNTITHHDGNSPTRIAAALLQLGGAGVVGQRRWDNDGIGAGFYASFVVGVRRNGAWQFYQQSYNYNQVGQGILPAVQVTQI
ncbi:MAG TPA: hypothetical protein VGC19_06015 [Rhodanobacter sp.]